MDSANRPTDLYADARDKRLVDHGGDFASEQEFGGGKAIVRPADAFAAERVGGKVFSGLEEKQGVLQQTQVATCLT
ncbi:hypothetical protein U1Q18_019822 [Sarracenia purpurea var. burkii]